MPAILDSIVTDRLVLRPAQPKDLDELAEILADPVVMRFVGDGTVLTRDEVERRMEEAAALHREHGFGPCAMVDRRTLNVVGDCGLTRTSDGQAEIGWRLSQAHWRRGYGTESGRAWLQTAWSLGIQRVVARAHPDHTAMRRLLEGLGMALVGSAPDEHAAWWVYAAVAPAVAD